MTVPSAAWHPLGTPAPTALTEARLDLHWAVQIVAAVPHTFHAPAADDSHTNLGWDAAAARFVARPVGSPAVRAALRVPDLTLELLGADGTTVAERALTGATLDEGYGWMAGALASATETGGRPVRRRDYDMPAHPVGQAGARFTAGGGAGLAELARWYTNAHGVLEAVRAAERRASELRTWPHHFDLATLIVFDADADPETARSINAGFSPGDDFYAEPYFYVTPWPVPDRLPALQEGRWHTEGFTAGVLPGTALVAGGTAAQQAGRAAGFVTGAVAACREVLGA